MRRIAVLAAALTVSLGSAASSSAHRNAIDCSRGYYLNVSGHCVHSPASSPAGATARCRDGTYSYSEHASGTCSYHGGVLVWIRHP
jgi:hypothetical protein